MEKMYSPTVLCDCQVISHRNFEPFVNITLKSPICSGPVCFMKRKEWRRVKALHEVKDVGRLHVFQAGDVVRVPAT